jgi:DHA1 family multidrug resistance protein-like MFS transporter
MKLANNQNPQNWSMLKKSLISSMMVLLTAVFTMGGPILIAGSRSIEDTFHVSKVIATLGLTTYLAGYGIGK